MENTGTEVKASGNACSLLSVMGGINALKMLTDDSCGSNVCDDIMDKFNELQLNKDAKAGNIDAWDGKVSAGDRLILFAIIGSLSTLAAFYKDKKMENMAQHLERYMGRLGNVALN